MNKNSLKELIDDGFNKMGLSLSEIQIKRMVNYTQFLIKENKKYNLTSITEPEEILKKHFLDSAGLLTKTKVDGKVIDIGTGAGFPGFVFKILNEDIELTLLESSLKKVNFLKMLQVELDLYKNMEVLHERAEDLGQMQGYRTSFDIVTSRAVASLNVLVEYTAPFCKENGKILLYKGPSYQEELEEAQSALQKLNLSIKQVHELAIPFLQGDRYIIEIVREGKLLDKYPRRAGIPKKRPL
jgi:16S rRNA (guanine527-N7)-methyltransferase